MTKRQFIITEIIRILYIILFVYASVNKLMDVEKFRVQIGQSPMLTDIAGLVAWAIPTVEIIIALCLSIPKYKLVGFYAAFGLMIAFTGYIIAITQFSQYIPCSCGGILEKLGWTEHLIFNIVFDLLAITAILLSSKSTKTEESYSTHYS